MLLYHLGFGSDVRATARLNYSVTVGMGDIDIHGRCLLLESGLGLGFGV